MTTRVLIAEDQPLMRAALRDCLVAVSDIEVVGEATNGRQAVELAHELNPGVALLDIRMPVMSGIEATALIVADPTISTRVVIVTTFDLDEYMVDALRAGASGFLLKDATPQELAQAVQAVAAGGAVLAPAVTQQLLARFARYLPTPTRDSQGPGLTPREEAVLGYVARGASNAQIASKLYLAESSVKTHVGHLLAKLNAPDRVHLVIHAYETGLVGPRARFSKAAEPGRGTLTTGDLPSGP